MYDVMWMKSASDIYISTFISKTLLFYKLFHNFILFYFILYYFQGHFILFLIWIYGLGEPSWLGRTFAAFLLADHIIGGRRG